MNLSRDWNTVRWSIFYSCHWRSRWSRRRPLTPAIEGPGILGRVWPGGGPKIRFAAARKSSPRIIAWFNSSICWRCWTLNNFLTSKILWPQNDFLPNEPTIILLLEKLLLEYPINTCDSWYSFSNCIISKLFWLFWDPLLWLLFDIFMYLQLWGLFLGLNLRGF